MNVLDPAGEPIGSHRLAPSQAQRRDHRPGQPAEQVDGQRPSLRHQQAERSLHGVASTRVAAVGVCRAGLTGERLMPCRPDQASHYVR
jgi:hypothetical protein